MKMLRITGCSNSSFWYAGMAGAVVQFIGLDRDEYVTREPSGFVNIVKFCDAELVDVTVAEPEAPPMVWRESMSFEILWEGGRPGAYRVEEIRQGVRKYIADWCGASSSPCRLA